VFSVETGTIHDYEIFGMWIHQGCHQSFDRRTNTSIAEDVEHYLGICSREEFRNLYEHVASVGLDFQSIQFITRVNHTERAELEWQSRLYYNKTFPNLHYQGITEISSTPDGKRIVAPRPEMPFYWPIHYAEPVMENGNVIDLDIYAAAKLNNLNKVIATYKPVLSNRLELLQEKEKGVFGIILTHPGTSTSVLPGPEPTSLAQVVIRVPDLLARASSGVAVNKFVYLFDMTDSAEEPDFLGALRIQVIDGETISTNMLEISFSDIRRQKSSHMYCHTESIAAADRLWSVTIVSEERKADLVYVILGGAMIFLACLMLAVWFHTHMSRAANLNQIRSEAEAEKSRNASLQVARERHMNEFLSHEVSCMNCIGTYVFFTSDTSTNFGQQVQNPLSSAISALSFVSTTVNDPNECQISDETTRDTMKYDLRIMDASLQFINELLRNMLDMHRSASNQMKLNLSVIDVTSDVLVCALLCLVSFHCYLTYNTIVRC